MESAKSWVAQRTTHSLQLGGPSEFWVVRQSAGTWNQLTKTNIYIFILKMLSSNHTNLWYRFNGFHDMWQTWPKPWQKTKRLLYRYITECDVCHKSLSAIARICFTWSGAPRYHQLSVVTSNTAFRSSLFMWKRYLWGKENIFILYMKISIIHKEGHERVW